MQTFPLAFSVPTIVMRISPRRNHILLNLGNWDENECLAEDMRGWYTIYGMYFTMAGGDYVRELCHLDPSYVEPEFGKLNTTRVVLTSERDEHIRTHHPQDYSLFEKYGVEVIEQPDIVLRDLKNQNTIIMIRRLAEIHINAVVRLSIQGQDAKENLNSVLTFFRLRQSNLRKQMAKNKIVYIKEDL